jgi:hypothetical protein
LIRKYNAMKRSVEQRKVSSPTAASFGEPEGQNRAEDKIRVLIADDHPTVLAGVSSIIGMQPDMVAQRIREAQCVEPYGSQFYGAPPRADSTLESGRAGSWSKILMRLTSAV